MTQPSVSVILPVRNDAATVGRALRSLTVQTLADWEAVVVDDGSSDRTAELLDTAAKADPRIRVMHRPAGGIVGALNAGIEAARAPLIARMDADDDMHPERLAAQIDLLACAPDLGLVSCLVGFGGSRVDQAGYALHVDWLNSLVTPEQIRLNRFVESPLAHPSVMFRRELCDRFGAYRDGAFPEDYELWLRWMDAGVGFAKVPRALLTWHDSPGRLSRSDPRYSPEAFYEMKAVWIAREVRRVAAGRPVWIRGAGRTARQRAELLTMHGLAIAGYVDVDPRKMRESLGNTGRPVIAPDRLPGPADAFVLSYVGRRGARELIRAELRARGAVEGADFLMCA